MATTLGLDLGPNSIGWALIEDDEANSRLVDMGVRVFPEGVDAFDTSKEKSRNEDRRIKRGMRRQIARRARRERRLADALITAGLWPADPALQEAELAKNPYELRVRALDEPITFHELGRIILHIARRRGFLSNRKSDAGDKEAQGMLAEIQENQQILDSGEFRTVGEMLYRKLAALDHCHRREDDHIRNRHLSRRQMADEMMTIWQCQTQHHPQIVTQAILFGELGPQYSLNPRTNLQELSLSPRRSIARVSHQRTGKSDCQMFGLFGIIFFQRKLYWPKSVVGLCEYEPGQKRCPRADRLADEFRIWQEINNLRFVIDGQEERLSDEQRKLAYSLLSVRKEVTFDQLRKKLGFLDSLRFNLERGDRSKLKGAVVDVAIAAVVGKEWHGRDDAEKTRIARLIANDDVDENHKLSKLQSFAFTLDQAESLLAIDLPTKYLGVSRRAIEKLLPHLRRGLVLQSATDPEQSAIHAAGYLRRDELQRRLFDELPDLSRTKAGDCRIGDIPNPVVKRALVELRKVVNAIIREYGKPDAVHIEMARNVQVGADRRKEMSKKMRDREKLRDAAAAEVRKAGVAVRRDSILRQLLWEQQSYDCVYCGKTISQHQRFDGATDIDHILPYSQCLDDSQMNKVLVHRECNSAKGQRTPYEWLAGSNPKQYDEVVQKADSLMRAGKMPYGKYKRFLQKQIDTDGFIARQLVDTGYITRATVEYVQLLFDQPSRVLGLRGQLTAELRWQWGLDTILSELPDSPAWSENADLTGGEKNRADHRHHAIDALVVALTNRKRLHRLTKLYKTGGARTHGEILEDPWDNFRPSVVERVKSINVSHRVQRKVSGALHEETYYGKGNRDHEWVVRKPLAALSANEFEKIRDPGIRRLVLDRLRQHGIEFGRGKKVDANKIKEALAGLTMPSGVPIKKVRVLKAEQTIRPLRKTTRDNAYVKPGSTHHLCIFEYTEKGKTKREAVFVTTLEAIQRIQRKQPVIQRTHPDRPDAKFVMSLSASELVLANVNGSKRTLKLRTSVSTEEKMTFQLIEDARREYQKINANKNTLFDKLNAQKVTVDTLGRIRWAND